MFRSCGLAVVLGVAFAGSVPATGVADTKPVVKLSRAQVEEIVRRSYQYVAMFNVNNKFAEQQGGWNTVAPDTALKDHTMRSIARPNNDSLYIIVMLDLRKDPVILTVPAFDSKYVSLMVTAYDHYVNVPMTTRVGDFKKPEKILFYSERTEGFDGKPVEGVDRLLESTGDFVSAIFRVMPHANQPERFKKITGQMKGVKLQTLSEFRGMRAKPIDDIKFPPVGKTDADVFGNNLLEVMQFVFNHTSFDPDNELDRGVLAAYKPLGIQPGKAYDPTKAATIDGAQFRRVSGEVATEIFALMGDAKAIAQILPYWGAPKGKTTLDGILAMSVIGPIGLPPTEAAYPPIVSADGKPLNALNDYVIRMTKEQLPPAKAFWSVTLYDLKDGFFIPNKQKKYSVGENAGFKLNADGGIEIHVAAEKPDGVPDENWLPINRKDEDLSINLRIYVADLEKMKTWKAPQAVKVGPR